MYDAVLTIMFAICVDVAGICAGGGGALVGSAAAPPGGRGSCRILGAR